MKVRINTSLLNLLFSNWELSLYILKLSRNGYDFDIEFLKKYLDETDILDYMKIFGPCPELEYKLKERHNIDYYEHVIKKRH